MRRALLAAILATFLAGPAVASDPIVELNLGEGAPVGKHVYVDMDPDATNGGANVFYLAVNGPMTFALAFPPGSWNILQSKGATSIAVIWSYTDAFYAGTLVTVSGCGTWNRATYVQRYDFGIGATTWIQNRPDLQGGLPCSGGKPGDSVVSPFQWGAVKALWR